MRQDERLRRDERFMDEEELDVEGRRRLYARRLQLNAGQCPKCQANPSGKAPVMLQGASAALRLQGARVVVAGENGFLVHGPDRDRVTPVGDDLVTLDNSRHRRRCCCTFGGDPILEKQGWKICGSHEDYKSGGGACLDCPHRPAGLLEPAAEADEEEPCA